MWNKLKNNISIKTEEMKHRLARRLLNVGGDKMEFNEYDNRALVKRWTDIYEGNPPWLSEDVVTRNMAAAVVSELAKKTVVELNSKVVGDARADYLNEQYQRVLDKIRDYTEHLLVQGSAILKPYTDGERIAVQYLKVGDFIPIKFNEFDELVEVMFIDRVEVDKVVYTKIEIHKLEDRTYTVTRRVFVGDGIQGDKLSGREVSLSVYEDWANLKPFEILENVDKPLYVYLKTPFANNKDVNSPLGVSVLSKIEGYLEDFDKTYSDFLWDIESSRATVEASDDLYKGPNATRPSKSIRLVNAELQPRKIEDLIRYHAPNIRYNDYIQTMETILRKIEFNAGLGYGDLSDVGFVAKTATEVISSKERVYETVADIQRVLERALRELVDIMDIIATEYNLAPKKTRDYEVTVFFDDSVITDKKTKLKMMLEAVREGALKPEYYIMESFGVTLEEAKEMVPED